MIILNYPQGSLDWFIQRLWRLTGSEMSANISAKTAALSKSEAAVKAIDKLIAGITLANVMIARKDEFDHMDDRELGNFMANYTGEKFFSGRHTERGHEREHLAVAALSEKTGYSFTDVGMVVMGDTEKGVISCSPDAISIDGNDRIVTGAEIKSPSLCHHLRHIRNGGLPDEYKLQVHACMIICECEQWEFASYSQECEEKPLHHVQVRWDDFTSKLKKSLEEFQNVYSEQYAATISKLKGGEQ